MSFESDIRGVESALDRLEQRVIAHRDALLQGLHDTTAEEWAAINETKVANAEVTTVESLVSHLAKKVGEESPDANVWELMDSYCSRNEEKLNSTRIVQDHEYFRWAVMWIEKTRTFLAYLKGKKGLYAAPIKTPREGRNDSTVKYDLALSFAGEDRPCAERIARLLTEAGCTIFYDKNEEANLWGKDLYHHLSEVYGKRARYCLVFVSKHYAEKLWTRHELKAAQARAFKERQEYILPLRLDDTDLQGLLPTTAYIDLTKVSDDKVVSLLLEKMSG